MCRRLHSIKHPRLLVSKIQIPPNQISCLHNPQFPSAYPEDFSPIASCADSLNRMLRVNEKSRLCIVGIASIVVFRPVEGDYGDRGNIEHIADDFDIGCREKTGNGDVRIFQSQHEPIQRANGGSADNEQRRVAARKSHECDDHQSQNAPQRNPQMRPQWQRGLRLRGKSGYDLQSADECRDGNEIHDPLNCLPNHLQPPYLSHAT